MWEKVQELHNKLVMCGFMRKVSKLDGELQRDVVCSVGYHIPWCTVYKASSISTHVKWCLVLHATPQAVNR